LRSGHDYQILAGTLSSRVYLKQANARSTDLLEKWLEPISTWVSATDLGAYPSSYMQFLWKELMKNHPHDSICGCSQDAVHEHMMDRFKALNEAGEELWKSQVGLRL
jgi:alpha-mannosidase